MFVNFNILNQLGSPAINSNTFANRPAAGQTGRLFVSTDTFEIYRDNGTTWDLIGGPGSSTITGTGTATQVAYFTSSQAIGSSANLYWDNTAGALGINTATPGAELDVHGTGTIAQFNTTAATGNVFLAIQRSGTGLWRIGDTYNSGSNYFELHNTTLASNAIQIAAATNKSILTSLETYSTGVARGNYLDYTLSLANGTTFTSPNTVTALGATLNLNIAGSATIPAGARSGADFFNGINFTSAGTFTVNQASTIRAFSNVTAGWAFNGSAVGTVTHLAGLRVLFPTNSGSAINVTDNYALLINNQNANTGTITYTNRWGIYQEGSSDLNYFAANTLIGSTVNNGNALQVTGNSNITGNLDIGGTGGTKNLNVFGDARLLNSQPTLDFTLNINTAFSHSIVGSNYSTSPLSSNTLEFRVANGANTQATVMTLNGAGNVGIGTTTPSFKLDVSGTVSNLSNRIFGTNGLAGYLLQQGDWLGTAATNLSIAAETGNGLSFFTNGSGTVRAFIPTSGNFLIGTTTDNGQKLQVNGSGIFVGTGYDSQSAEIQLINTTATTGRTFVLNSLNSGGFQIADKTSGGATRFLINSTGNTEFFGTIKTPAPTTGTAAEWKLGSRVAATVVVNTTEYIEVDIGGTLYKLATVT